MAVLDEMEAAQLTPDTWTYNTLLNVLSKAGRCDDAFALVERMRTATPRVVQDAVTFNTLLSSCVQSGQVTPHDRTPPRQCVLGFHHQTRSHAWSKRSRVCCTHEKSMAANNTSPPGR
jgi:pentatricopeptide repeat protein